MIHATLRPLVLAVPLALLACCAATAEDRLGLERVLVQGPDLHPALETVSLPDGSSRLLPAEVQPTNPHLSTDLAFVDTVARYGSQGNLDGMGMGAALFGLYHDGAALGIYGLEALSAGDASYREALLRDIWAHNVRGDRARVHRGGEVLLVVFHDGVPAETWEAVNEELAERLVRP